MCRGYKGKDDIEVGLLVFWTSQTRYEMSKLALPAPNLIFLLWLLSVTDSTAGLKCPISYQNLTNSTSKTPPPFLFSMALIWFLPISFPAHLLTSPPAHIPPSLYSWNLLPEMLICAYHLHAQNLSMPFYCP